MQSCSTKSSETMENQFIIEAFELTEKMKRSNMDMDG